MAWISGRTLSPASNELVFLIDENANLPGPQIWEQIWQTCSGIEPISSERFTYLDILHQTTFGRGGIAFSPAEYLSSVSAEDVEFTAVDDRDIDPQSRCTGFQRQVTISIVNFAINDGGESIIETEGCIDGNCASISLSLRTRGSNPSRRILDAAFPDDLMRAIGWQESRWRHFLPDGKPFTHKNTNGTIDWGLMQINEATDEQKWNWKSNLARSVAILGEKRVLAEKYLNEHPPFTTDMLQKEMIQRYNHFPYHKWDSNLAAWIVAPFNGYADSILSLLTDKPWLKLS